MKIIIRYIYKDEIVVIDVVGNLTSRGAIEFQDYLYTCLDEGKSKLLINFKHVKKVDGLGINVLLGIMRRGMYIRLYNAGLGVRSIIKMSKKEHLIKVYKEPDHNKIVSLFEKEILNKKDKFKASNKGRRSPRIDAFYPAKFKLCPKLNGAIAYKANVLNFSAGGLLVDNIVSLSTNGEELVSISKFLGQKINDLKLKLNGSSKIIIKGVCVWGEKINKNLSVGIRFKGLSKEDKAKICDYSYDIN